MARCPCGGQRGHQPSRSGPKSRLSLAAATGRGCVKTRSPFDEGAKNSQISLWWFESAKNDFPNSSESISRRV